MPYSNWEDEHKKEIQKYLGDNCKCGFLGFSLSNRNTTPINSNNVSEYNLILGYDSYFDIYTAWNPKVHQNLRGKEHTFGCGKIKSKDLNKFTFIYPIYKSLHNNGYYEKMLLIKSDCIKEFCKYYYLYLYPNKTDEGFNPKVICGFDGSNPIYLSNNNLVNEITRKRFTCSQLERNSIFRKIILEHFDATCIVCGCKENKLLQAAHIIPVSEGGSDEIDNGYCLCANHHLLFDNGLLDINLDNGIFKCISNEEKSMSWYRDAQKRNFRLFLNNNDKNEKE